MFSYLQRMIELLSSHDCHEVMREARSSHSVSGIILLTYRVYILHLYVNSATILLYYYHFLLKIGPLNSTVLQCYLRVFHDYFITIYPVRNTVCCYLFV